jgi:hypothetical protein
MTNAGVYIFINVMKFTLRLFLKHKGTVNLLVLDGKNQFSTAYA